MDDEAGVRQFLVNALKPLGHKLLVAEDGEEAVAIGLRENPEIALLDIRVPGKDGIEVFAELKKNNPEMLAIMISGFGDEDSLQQIKQLGAFAFLQKPFLLDTLLETVQQAIDSLQK